MENLCSERGKEEGLLLFTDVFGDFGKSKFAILSSLSNFMIGESTLYYVHAITKLTFSQSRFKRKRIYCQKQSAEKKLTAGP